MQIILCSLRRLASGKRVISSAKSTWLKKASASKSFSWRQFSTPHSAGDRGSRGSRRLPRTPSSPSWSGRPQTGADTRPLDRTRALRDSRQGHRPTILPGRDASALRETDKYLPMNSEFDETQQAGPPGPSVALAPRRKVPPLPAVQEVGDWTKGRSPIRPRPDCDGHIVGNGDAQPQCS